jgi:putative glutamine amidotransferase
MKKPIVGVVPLWDSKLESLWMLPGYFDGVRMAGGLPVMLPLRPEPQDIPQLYELCDGLLFTGGQDAAPALYGAAPIRECGQPCPDRDRLETVLFRLAYADDKPVLGICRGIQLINVLLGGTLYQDLPSEHPGAVEHRMSPPYDRVCHTVRLDRKSPLGQLLGTEELGVNSYHHQGVKGLSPALKAAAYAPDGLVEAIYAPGRRFLWAVQWHPEYSLRSSPSSAAIFRAFLRACLDRP